jgi:hypothetical protein
MRHSHSSPAPCIHAGARCTVPAVKSTTAPRWLTTGTLMRERLRSIQAWPLRAPSDTTSRSALEVLMRRIVSSLLSSSTEPNPGDS